MYNNILSFNKIRKVGVGILLSGTILLGGLTNSPTALAETNMSGVSGVKTESVVVTNQSVSTSANTVLSTTTHKVVKGDTLYKLSKKYGTTVSNIQSLNGLKGTTIHIGQTLKVSGTTSAVTKVSNTTSTSVKSSTKKSEVVQNNSSLISNAKKYLGVRYTYGGSSASTGFDCSGFVYRVFSDSGKNIGRTSAAGLYSKATKVSNPQVGDLVFFAGTYKKGISHVGIYIGDGQMIQASGKKVNISNINNGYWNKYFVGYGRI